jgi:hypothetical protein
LDFQGATFGTSGIPLSRHSVPSSSEDVSIENTFHRTQVSVSNNARPKARVFMNKYAIGEMMSQPLSIFFTIQRVGSNNDRIQRARVISIQAWPDKAS